MSDKKIPGPVYLIIGAAMILMSVFIDPEKLLFFILVGAVLVVVGFLKILMREKKKVNHAVHHPAEHHATPMPHHTPEHKQSLHQQPAHHAVHTTTTISCSNCGVKLHPLFKFCPNCGQKLK
jgi:hypothetical protein